MAGYRKTSPKYSIEKTQELTMNALEVLMEAKTALTIDEICACNMNLVNQTAQKMARVLNDLVENGMVIKTKSKSKKKMVYAAVAALEEQGYNVEEMIY